MTDLPIPENDPPALLQRTRHDPALVVRSDDATQPAGSAASERPLRDAIIDVALRQIEGPDDATFGLVVRQSTPNRYVLWTLTRQRRFRVGLVDEAEYLPVHDGMLATDIPFAEGMSEPNRFTVVAFGPSLTFVINNHIVTAVMVDQRWMQGHAGPWVRATGEGPAAVGCDWFMARSVLAG